MAIITISREFAALGEETVAELSKLTGYRIIDRNYFDSCMDDQGYRQEQLQKFDEKRPGLWSSFSEDWADYIQCLRLAMYEEASQGDCIIMGRGGTAILRDLPNQLAARITAPIDIRIERAMKSLSCGERHARQIVEQYDHDRLGFNKINFGLEWADPREYDITLNTACLDAALAARLLKSFLDLAIGEEEEAAGQKMIPDLLLSQRVLTEINRGKKVHLPSLTVTASGDVVTLSGLSSTTTAMEIVLAAARSVPGVREVKNELHLVQEYTM